MIGFAAGGATVGTLACVPAQVLSRVTAKCGCDATVVPLYIGEVAPKSQRGSLTSLNQFACTAAILVSEIAGVWLSYNPGWRYLLGGTAGIAVLQLLSAPFLPESPKYVEQPPYSQHMPHTPPLDRRARFLVSRRQAGDVQQAQRVLMKLRGYTADKADAEIAELQEASSAGGQAVKRMSVGEIFSSKRLRVRLLVLVRGCLVDGRRCVPPPFLTMCVPLLPRHSLRCTLRSS